MSPFLIHLSMMTSTEVLRFHTYSQIHKGSTAATKHRVLMRQQCHHVVIECLPLR